MPRPAKPDYTTPSLAKPSAAVLRRTQLCRVASILAIAYPMARLVELSPRAGIILAMSSRKEGYHDAYLRMPVEVWEALREEAEREERSATAQLVHILRERYKIDPPKPKRTK